VADTVAMAIALIAVATDLRSRRIPNALTLGAALAAFGFAAIAGGPSLLLASAEGWALGLLLWLPFYALGGMGAGDVKLLAALGAWLGPAAVLRVAIYGAIAGAVLAVFVALRARYLRTAMQNVGTLLTTWRVAGIGPVDAVTLESSRGPRLAYAIPALAGALLAVYWQ
jgi:prepilin peptidase CpaA